MLIVPGLKGHGFRQVEALILGFVATIGVCFELSRASGAKAHARWPVPGGP